MSTQPDFADAFDDSGEPSPVEQAREAIEQARDELDEALQALSEDHDASAALLTVTGCSEHIGKALWLLHLAQGEESGTRPA